MFKRHYFQIYNLWFPPQSLPFLKRSACSSSHNHFMWPLRGNVDCFQKRKSMSWWGIKTQANGMMCVQGRIVKNSVSYYRQVLKSKGFLMRRKVIVYITLRFEEEFTPVFDMKGNTWEGFAPYIKIDHSSLLLNGNELFLRFCPNKIEGQKDMC
jgi:hypothetical protein